MRARGLSEKSELYFFFRTQFLLTDKVIKNKRGLELVTGCSSGYKTNLEKFISYIIAKIRIFQEWKEIFRQNKKTFSILFEGLSFGEKIKI